VSDEGADELDEAEKGLERGPEAAPPTAEEKDVSAEPDDRPRSAHDEPPRAVVPRWVQLAVLPIALLAVWGLLSLAGSVLLIFIVAALIALILNPAVAFLQRRRLPRGLAVLAVYLGFFIVIGGIGFGVANPISSQVQKFANNLPHLVDEANKQIASLQHTLNKDGLHVHLVKQGKTALQTIQAKLAKSASKIASSSAGILTEAAGVIFDLVLIFVLSVYMLLYGEQIGALVRSAMPTGDGSDADDYPHLVQRAVSRYVGGQLLFSALMGASAGVSLYIFGLVGLFPDGKTYAIAFGVFYAAMELVPYIGPILGAAPPVLVALFTKPISAVWLIFLFIGLQQLEGHVVAPQVFGHTLRINPILVIFALLLGLHVDGILGALVALPILSVVRETVVYLSRHLTLERWDRSRESML
jgi:predicted PurR-regulated permease PerM